MTVLALAIYLVTLSFFELDTNLKDSGVKSGDMIAFSKLSQLLSVLELRKNPISLLIMSLTLI